MRILFFSEQFWPETNAPAIHVYERARAWVQAGHHVTVVTSAPNFPEGKLFFGYKNRWRAVEMIEGIRVVRVKTYITANEGKVRRILDYISYMVSAFANACLEERPDVVISTSPQLFTAVAGVFQAMVRGVPHIFELRDLWPASILAVKAMRPGLGLRMLEGLELWLYRRSNRVLAFTEAFKNDLVRRGVPPSKVEVIPNGVDLNVFYPRPRDEGVAGELGLPINKKVVAYFGTLGLAHGLEGVLEAMALVKDQPIHLLMAGPGAERGSLEAKISELGLRNVTLLPRQPRERMPGLWSLVDLALISLRDVEVFRTVIPSKLYEAVAMGCPVLFTGPEGEASALIGIAGFGVCVPPESPELLAEALCTLLLDGDSLASMVGRAEMARPYFSREVQVQRCLEVLDQVRAR